MKDSRFLFGQDSYNINYSMFLINYKIINRILKPPGLNILWPGNTTNIFLIIHIQIDQITDQSIFDASDLSIIQYKQFMLESCIQSEPSPDTDASKRKIQLCRTYVESGYCRFGDSCFFAHGLQELQISQPVLKSKFCRNYCKNYQCKYGDRCNFRHQNTSIIWASKLLSCFKEYPQLFIYNNLADRKCSKIFAPHYVFHLE